MCQISVINLHNEYLNKKMFLLAGSTGSVEHDDGWGLYEYGGKVFKCELPLYWTSNAGQIIRTSTSSDDDPILLGHIRQASPLVPVTKENAHPFVLSNITFVHNGKLTPKDEKKFVTEVEITEYDEKTKSNVIKKVKRSDSLVFFEHFVCRYKDNASEKDLETRFKTSLTEAMEDFTGKFAMVFVINGVYYIVRGKTADLYISYLVNEKNTQTYGWVINTSKVVLEVSTNLLSNLSQLDGEEELYFSAPKLLAAETIHRAEKLDVVCVGEIKENVPPVTTYHWSGETGAGNFTRAGATTSGVTKNKVEKDIELIVEFMLSYSLSPSDIQYIMFALYNISTLEVNEQILGHFARKIIPELKRYANKAVRKIVKKNVFGYFPMYRYTSGIEFPWFLNSRDVQSNLIKELTKKPS